MRRLPLTCAIIMISCAGLAGCGGRLSTAGNGGTFSGTAPVVLAMTDAPPMKVSILSAEVTLTGATLNPGNIPLLTGATTIELTHLQAAIDYIGTTLVPPGSYTSLTLMFSNPLLTIENDTGGLVAGAVCTGTICTIAPISPSFTTTLPITMTVSSTNGAGLLVDVNLNNLLSTTLGADFSKGVTVSQFVPAGTGAPLVGAQDVVGQVVSVDATHTKFLLQNAVTSNSLNVDNTTTFLNFPAGTCLTPTIACVQANQILSVDIGIRADGTPVARNVIFEDPNSTDVEVEGIITSTGSLQFTMITLAESAPVAGLNIGGTAIVHFTTSTPSNVDFVHADNIPVVTTGFTFNINVPTDLVVGQQVVVLRNPTLSVGTSITADRVRLRSSSVTGTFQSGTPPLFTLAALPSLFTAHAIPLIQVQTSSGGVSAICSGTGFSLGSNCSSLAITHIESVRGPLFANSGNPMIIASAVFQH